jgi:adenylate cyclase
LLFGQQVSREVSRELIEEKGATKRREATVMFLDIRNFTGFADSHTADEVIDYQNKVLGPLIDIINQHQGVVFQILGDGLMACFGSPGENVLHADMAFQASLSILRQVKGASKKQIIPETTVGIGLHSGLVVTGNIGNERRKQFSISGTPVIVASRIEQLNKKYGTQLLISGQVYQQIAKGKMELTSLGEEPLKGILTPVAVYKVI